MWFFTVVDGLEKHCRGSGELCLWIRANSLYKYLNTWAQDKEKLGNFIFECSGSLWCTALLHAGWVHLLWKEMGWEISATCSLRKSTGFDILLFDLCRWTSAARSSVDFWPSILGYTATVYISANIITSTVAGNTLFPSKRGLRLIKLQSDHFLYPNRGMFLL